MFNHVSGQEASSFLPLIPQTAPAAPSLSTPRGWMIEAQVTLEKRAWHLCTSCSETRCCWSQFPLFLPPYTFSAGQALVASPQPFAEVGQLLAIQDTGQYAIQVCMRLIQTLLVIFGKQFS